MKYFYDIKTNSFFIDTVNDVIPESALQITEQQHNELYLAINAGCIIFDDLSYSEPPPAIFYKWNGKTKKWVKDKEAENAAAIAQNQTMKNSLINEANDKIVLLQDIIDLDMQEADEEVQLKKWKKYRILLTRIDTSDIKAVFPDKP